MDLVFAGRIGCGDAEIPLLLPDTSVAAALELETAVGRQDRWRALRGGPHLLLVQLVERLADDGVLRPVDGRAAEYSLRFRDRGPWRRPRRLGVRVWFYVGLLCGWLGVGAPRLFFFWVGRISFVVAVAVALFIFRAADEQAVPSDMYSARGQVPDEGFGLGERGALHAVQRRHVPLCLPALQLQDRDG